MAERRFQYIVAWTERTGVEPNPDELVHKRKTFNSEREMDKFVEELLDKEEFVQLTDWATEVDLV